MAEPAAADPICIYCKRSGIVFDREHVIPQAFGSYDSDTMVLADQVCRDCNASFGAKLDLILSRDSFEATLRADSLPIQRKKADTFQARRIVIRVPDEEKWGMHRGARMILDWQIRKLKPLDQILVRGQDGKMFSFTLDELSSAPDYLFHERPPGAVSFLGDASVFPKFKELARSKGARLDKEPVDVEVPAAAKEKTIFLEVEGFIDQQVWRAIAKIAFNYLAFIQGPAYVLQDRFDRIREYIIGQFHDRQLVMVSKQPVLADDDLCWRGFKGHLVLFERIGYGMRGKVSLFNSFTYEVILSPDLGLFYPIKSGHAFDPFRHKTYPLTGISRKLSRL